MKCLFFLLLIIILKVYAQTNIPFNSPRWKITAKEAVLEEYLGKPCLKITNGSALLSDAAFRNGIIEFDIAIEHARYFPGMGFRVQDSANAEEFYLRPHQSGNPDAMQYYPEFNGSGGWQLYYGRGFGNAHALPFDRWLHIKMLIKNDQGEVYFDDEKEPVLFMEKLKRPIAAGMISLENQWPVAARYANFSYTATDDVTLKSKPVPFEPLPAGVITTWQVSSPFDEKLVNNKPLLSSFDTSSLTWQSLTVEERGVADLSILAGAVPGKNTVFARVVIESEKAETKKLTFGFSDRAKLYFNGRLLYSGEDNFLSRDYRFLGTMGYYDAVYLNLKKGKNEVWIAISEDIGGWGVQAKLEKIL